MKNTSSHKLSEKNTEYFNSDLRLSSCIFFYKGIQAALYCLYLQCVFHKLQHNYFSLSQKLMKKEQSFPLKEKGGSVDVLNSSHPVSIPGHVIRLKTLFHMCFCLHFHCVNLNLGGLFSGSLCDEGSTGGGGEGTGGGVKLLPL